MGLYGNTYATEIIMQMLFLEFSMPSPIMRKQESMADVLAPIPEFPRVLKKEDHL